MANRYFWIATVDECGKPFLIYGGTDEISAQSKGLELLAGLDFIIKMFPTKNIARASQMFKGEKLEKTGDLREAKKRLRHKLRRK